MAEAIFRKTVAGRDEYSVGSAGVAAGRGSQASRETLEICKQSGAPLENFKSRAVTEELLKEATHVFTMTRGHLGLLEEHFPEFSDKYYLACEFVDINGMGLGADVPDPIGMGKKAYEDVARVMGEAIPAIIAYIDQTTPREG